MCFPVFRRPLTLGDVCMCVYGYPICYLLMAVLAFVGYSIYVLWTASDNPPFDFRSVEPEYRDFGALVRFERL